MTMTQKTYSIGELAREFGITNRSIRFYEEKGFLTPERAGTKRIFSAADRVRLKLILRGKRLGLSLEDSVAIVDLYDPVSGNAAQRNELLKQLDARKLQLESQRKEIDLALAELEDVKRRVLSDKNQ